MYNGYLGVNLYLSKSAIIRRRDLSEEESVQTEDSSEPNVDSSEQDIVSSGEDVVQNHKTDFESVRRKEENLASIG